MHRKNNRYYGSLDLIEVNSTQYQAKSLPSGAQTELTPDVAEVVLVIPEVPTDFASAMYFRARFLTTGTPRETPDEAFHKCSEKEMITF